jgi:hypothetical protein
VPLRRERFCRGGLTNYMPLNSADMVWPPSPMACSFALVARPSACRGWPHTPGQAHCLALGFWPECFRRLDVKGGRRTFPKETQSALDIEGKHVTIQGPSPDLSPARTVAPFPYADRPYLLSLDYQLGNQTDPGR